MTLLGKFLVVFNLLAAGAFAYFAVQDWRGRQTITAAAVRHGLVVKGLPLGEANSPPDLPSDPEAEIPFRFEMAGGFRTETIGKKVLDAYFQQMSGKSADTKRDPDLASLDGGAVSSQLGEVKRVKTKIDAAWAESGDRTDKKLKMATVWLLDQAEIYSEREAILALIKAGDADGMKARLDARFAAVLDPKAPDTAFAAEPLPRLGELNDAYQKALADNVGVTEAKKALEEGRAKLLARSDRVDETRGVPLDTADRLARIAHLLAHLDVDAEWQKRVMGVVGLRVYARTIFTQTERFRLMAEHVSASLAPDQAAYLAEERLLLRRAIHDTDLVNRQADLKLKWIEQEKKDADFVGQRTTQLKAIRDRLAKLKAEVDDLLARQTATESALFEVQREVAVTLDEVYRLEARLEEQERELLKRPANPGNK